MTDAVPEVITRYIHSAAATDFDTLVACFTDDAEVTDEDVTHVGPAAIRQWREALASAFEYTVEVLGAERTGDDSYLVTTKVEGTFPGSPVELRYNFTLRGDLISTLSIAP
jgi:ketosteroid isomerase-like protein